MRRQRDHAIATPPSLIARLAKATARAEVFWVEARKANDFKIFAPHLEEVVQLVRDKAALLGQARGLAPYDARVDAFTPGISTADIDTIFKALSRKLPGLINQAIEVQADRAPIPLVGKFSISRQRSLAVDVLKALGFPFDRGRLDESEHPFTEGVPGDIRVTTRFDANDLFSGLLGAVHEADHDLYDIDLTLKGAISRWAGPRSRARGKPVAAVRNEPVPQPFLCEVSEAAAGEIFAGERSGMERRQSLPASHAREAQSDSHGRG
jgi:carboxypeptidase Taq